jgi:hypothetical protein
MAQRLAVLTKVFRGFPQSIQAITSVVPYIRPTAGLDTAVRRKIPAPTEIESKISTEIESKVSTEIESKVSTSQ